MIINLKNVKQDFALGLRWLVATRTEVDYLKDKENLSYCFVNSIKGGKRTNYKCVVLTSHEHDKAISLAGLFAEKYEHLIFVHKVQSDLYWLCIIKNHEVCNDLDVGNFTAGDYLCNKESADEILQAVQDLFIESEISIKNIIFSSTQAQEDFPQFPELKLSDVVSGSKKYFSKYTITWLQSYRKKVKRIATFLIILIALIITGSYLYSSQNAAAREKARLLRIQMEREQAAHERLQYIQHLMNQIYQQQGSRSIDHVLQMVGRLSLESSGWRVTNIFYNSNPFDQLKVSLTRGIYGDILSFRHSYLKRTLQETILNDNNSGTKLLDFKELHASNQPNQKELEQIHTILLRSSNDQRYKLIAYAQRMNLQLTTDAVNTNRYNYVSTTFTMNGSGLWNMRKLQYIFNGFPTVVIQTADLKIDNENTISWTIKGVI